MIQANELRIGNWIYNNNVKYQVTPYIIEELWASVRGWIQPIPITEEILNKCKWDIDKYYINKSIRIDIKGCVWYGITFTGIVIKTLHELQNFYFSLTKTELEVNL